MLYKESSFVNLCILSAALGASEGEEEDPAPQAIAKFITCELLKTERISGRERPQTGGL